MPGHSMLDILQPDALPHGVKSNTCPDPSKDCRNGRAKPPSIDIDVGRGWTTPSGHCSPAYTVQPLAALD
nr:hypothetical protein CFP56_22113 [Quercus suber]